MNDKEKLQYLYDKEKAKEEKQERKQGQVLFAGGMIGYLVISAFKIVVMSFFPLLFFYFLLGISGMYLIVISLIAGVFFFYTREGQDIKEDMGDRAMMEEFRNGHLSYKGEELENNMTEAKEREELGNNKESVYFQKSLYANKIIANGFFLILKIDRALNNMPIIKSYIEKHGLKNAEEIPYLRENFYIPLSQSAEKPNEFGYLGAITEENNVNISEDWERAVESDVVGMSENHERATEINLLENIFDQAIREAMKIGRRESYYDLVYILKNLGKYFDCHSEEEWRNRIERLEEGEKQSLKVNRKRLLIENEKREIGLI